jgi:transposase InsO family protein
MIYPVVRELAADGVPVATACRVLQVSASGYYDWLGREPSARQRADAELAQTITAVHAASYGTYGARRVHAELRLGQNLRVGRKRVERLMRCHRLQGVHRRRLRGCTRRDAAAQPAEDLVQRRFTAHKPDRLYVADITQHRTDAGWLYLAVVLDVFSRRVVGWAMADHLRSELVVDALQMALWQRRPANGAIHHSDHGSQGGLNRSSQHLTITEVRDGTTSAAGGSSSSAGDALAGSADAGQACGAPVLALDRAGQTHRGRRARGRRVLAGRVAVVSPRWRHAAAEPGRAHRPLPVLRRA